MIYLLLSLLSAAEKENNTMEILSNGNSDLKDFVIEVSNMDIDDFDSLNPTIQIMNIFSNLNCTPNIIHEEDIVNEIMNLNDSTISVVSDIRDTDDDNYFSDIKIDSQTIYQESDHYENIQLQAGGVNLSVDNDYSYVDNHFDVSNFHIYENINSPEKQSVITFYCKDDLIERTNSDFKDDFLFLFPSYINFYRKVVSQNFAATNSIIRDALKNLNYKSIQTLQTAISSICLINSEIQTKGLKLTFFNKQDKRPNKHQNFFLDALYDSIDITKYGPDNLISLSSSFITLLKNLETSLFFFEKSKTCYLRLFIFDKIDNLKSSVCKYMLLQYYLLVDSYNVRKINNFELLKCLVLSKYLESNFKNMTSKQFCDFILILIPPHYFSQLVNLKTKMGNVLDCLYRIKIRETKTINFRDVYKYFGILLMIKEYKHTIPICSEEDIKDIPDFFIDSMTEFVYLTMNNEININK